MKEAAFLFLLFPFLCLGYGRPVVVQVDLQYPFGQLNPKSHSGRQFTQVRVNDQKLICGDLSKRATHLQHASNVSHEWDIAPQGPGIDWNNPLNDWTPESQTMQYLIASKMSHLMDQCFIFKTTSDAYWAYDICLGRTMGQFHQSRQTSLSTGIYNGLGILDSSKNEVYANGTVIQHYTNGTEGRSTTVRLECGVDQHATVASISEDLPLQYFMFFKGPSFCDWRDTEHSKTTSNLDASQLLQGLEGWCANFTDGGWWSYEYCHPDSLTQFRMDPQDGTVDKKMYLLGALYPLSTPAFNHFKTSLHKTELPPPPSSAFVKLRSPSILQPQPSSAVRWLSLPIELVEATLEASPMEGNLMSTLTPVVSILDKPLKSLKLTMQNGTSCPMGRPRETIVYFSCPTDFLHRPIHRIVSIREVSFCSYELHVATPFVCAHPQILPQRQPKAETVICYPEEAFVASNNSFRSSSRPYEHRPGRPGNAAEQQRQLNIEDVERLRSFSIANSPELLPLSFSVVQEGDKEEEGDEGEPQGVFGMGYYERKRSQGSPNFRVGEIVRHVKLGMNAVVIGWDLECRAPASWLSNVLVAHPTSARLPFYLLLIDESELDKERVLPVKILYSPQVVLELASVEVIENQHLANYFSTFNPSQGRYRSNNEDLQRLYPDDVSPDDSNEEPTPNPTKQSSSISSSASIASSTSAEATQRETEEERRMAYDNLEGTGVLENVEVEEDPTNDFKVEDANGMTYTQEELEELIQYYSDRVPGGERRETNAEEQDRSEELVEQRSDGPGHDEL